MLFWIGFNIVAIVNLFLLSAILLFKKPHSKANKLLSVIVTFPAYAMLLNLLCYKQLAENYEWVFYVSYLSNYLWAPFFYWYIHLMLQKPLIFSVKQLLHFLPFFVASGFFIWLNFQTVDDKHQLLIRAQSDDYPWQFLTLDLMTTIQFFLYQFVCYKIVAKRIKIIKETFSDQKSVSAQWLQEYIVIYSLLGTLAFFPVVINSSMEQFLIYLPIASLGTYYYLVSKSISSPIVFTPEALLLIETNEDEDEKQQEKLVTEENLQLALRMEQVMQEEKLFLNLDFNIQELSKSCDSTVHVVSRILNNFHQKNFYDYVNSYRVEEAKRMLLCPEQELYTIESVSKEVGFNSRSAFYSAFKKHTGLTPKEFKSKSMQS